MLTFKEFKELDSEDKILELIRKGMNLQRGDDFWSDLISLTGNVEGMAGLFDVPKEKITALAGKINKLKSKVDAKESKIKDKLMKTGDRI
jgi:hypothetical protein